MKNILNTVLLMAMLVISIAICDEVFFSNVASAESSIASTTANASITKATVSNDLKIAYEKQDDLIASTSSFFAENWGKLSLAFLAFLEVVARLTPSATDNTVISYLKKLLDSFIPNKAKNGTLF